MLRPFLALVVLTACARSPSPLLGTDTAAEGRALYLRACASCHGADARGAGAVAPALRVPPPDLTGLRARHGGTFPREWVIDVVVGKRQVAAHGTREMPVWSERFGPGLGGVASVWAHRRDQLIADYLESLQRE